MQSCTNMESQKLLEEPHTSSGPPSLLSLDRGPSRKGINVLVAVLLVIGFDSSGMLKLPYTMVGAGFLGLGLMVLCLVNVAFCGSRLAGRLSNHGVTTEWSPRHQVAGQNSV